MKMVKLCDDFLVKHFPIIFQNCINSSVFPDSWKKSNIVPIHRKNDKQLINNYRPVSLWIHNMEVARYELRVGI